MGTFSLWVKNKGIKGNLDSINSEEELGPGTINRLWVFPFFSRKIMLKAGSAEFLLPKR